MNSLGAFVAILSFLAASHVNAFEIYLRELTVYTSHESSFFSNTPEVYLICDDDRDPMFLRTVVTVNKKYEFAAEQIPATHVNAGDCVACTLKEFDLLDDDDIYGKMKLCADGFGANGVSDLKVEGEFSAKFECPLCKAHHAEQHCNDKAEKEAPGIDKVTLRSAGVKVNGATMEGTDKEETKQQGVSTMGVVGIGMALFVVGVAVGVLAVRYLPKVQRNREMRRMHEMSPYMANRAEIPYDKLPNDAPGSTSTASRTLRVGDVTYSHVSTDENADSSS